MTTSTKAKQADAKVTALIKVPTKTGAKAIALKSDKHVGVIAAALGKLADTEQDADSNRWLWVKTADAQKVVDTLGAWSTEHSSVIYDARLAVATLVDVRRVFPKVTDEKTALTNVVVSALNEALASGKISAWTSTIKIDGTLRLSMTKGTKVTEGGARDIAKALDVSRPKAEGSSSGSSRGEQPRNAAGLTAAQQGRADRVAAMKAEGKAVKEWKAAGGVGPRPETPVTDQADAERAAQEEQERQLRAADEAAEAELVETHKAKQADKRTAKSEPHTEGLAELFTGTAPAPPKPRSRDRVNTLPKSETNGRKRTPKG